MGGDKRRRTAWAALTRVAAALVALSAPAAARAATILGEDDRELMNAYLNDAERAFFSGVGVVRCLTESGRINVSTAFHAGSFATMVTTAHGLYTPGKRQRVKPGSCRVVFYDNAGQSIEEVRVAQIASRWDEPGSFGDDTQDVAIIRLRKPTKLPRHHYLYRAGAPLSGPEPVSMVGFHFEVPNPTVVRKVQGVAYPPPAHFQHEVDARLGGKPFAEPRNLAVADYDNSRGSSGGPVFDANRRVIGVNKGAAGGYSNVFNPYSNYTLVVLFDARFDADLKKMVARAR